MPVLPAEDRPVTTVPAPDKLSINEKMIVHKLNKAHKIISPFFSSPTLVNLSLESISPILQPVTHSAYPSFIDTGTRKATTGFYFIRLIAGQYYAVPECIFLPRF